MKKIHFKSGNLTLVGYLFFPKKVPAPAVIICHGLANRSTIGSHRIRLAKLLAENGIAAFLFRFRAHGESQGKSTDLTASGGINDLKAAMHFLQKRPEVIKNRIGVYAPSFGGKVAILTASQDKRIKCLVTFAARPYLSFTRDPIQRTKFEKEGFFKWTGNYILSRKFLADDIKQNTFHAASKLRIPWLVIQGSKDIPSDAREFYRRAKSQKKLIILKGLDHWYKGKPQEKIINRETVKWFKRWLGPRK